MNKYYINKFQREFEGLSGGEPTIQEKAEQYMDDKMKDIPYHPQAHPLTPTASSTVR